MCHLHATRQRSAAVVGPPGAPDPVVRDGHPAVLTLTHKQRVYHLLARAVIVWERPSTAHREGGLECPAAVCSDSSIGSSSDFEMLSKSFTGLKIGR